MADTNSGSATGMERHIVNPWTWQDAFGFVQANDVIGARRVLYCSGQVTAIGDFGERLAAAGCRPASTLLGVTRLAFAEQVVELEATAVE